MILFERVKKLCKKQGITLQTLAEKTNMSINSLYKWKSHTPNVESLESVANYFNVSTDYLLGRTEDPEMKSYNDKTHGAVAKLIFGSSPEYTEIMENLPNLDESELKVVNSMIKSLIELKQKKS